MVASIITEHPRIEFRFITSPSGRRGYPNYRPGFSHIKKVALPKTSHLNKGWIRKSFAFSLPFLFERFSVHFFPSGVLFYVGVQRSSSVVLLPDPAAGKYAHLWVSGKAVVDETSAGSKMYVSVCVCACACRDTALASCLSLQICLSDFEIV